MYLKFLTINIICSALSISIVNSQQQQQQQQQLPPNCHTTTKTTVICQNVPDTVISLVPLNTTHLSLSEMNHVNGTSLDTELSRLTNLQYLNISENKFIDTIPFKALNNLINLTSLILRGNSIKSFPIELKDINRNIIIDVSENPIQCTCTTVYIVEKSTTVELIGQCSEPFKTALNSLNSSILNCDPCSNKNNNRNCLNGGDCINIDALTSKCQCLPSFTGPYCTTPVRQQECAKNNCQNGGTCYTDTFDSSTFCACLSGTTGDQCQIMTSEKPNDGDDSNIIIAVVVPVSVLFVLIAIGCWYFVNIRPKRRRLRSNRKTKQKDSTASDIQICAQVIAFISTLIVD